MYVYNHGLPFSAIKSPSRRYYVNLQKCVNDDDKIWTLEMNEKNKNVPIVLLHGFGAGLGFWIHNLEALAKSHHVYAFDILGLARSSRPSFSNDALEIEQVNIYLIMIDSDRSYEKKKSRKN